MSFPNIFLYAVHSISWYNFELWNHPYPLNVSVFRYSTAAKHNSMSAEKNSYRIAMHKRSKGTANTHAGSTIICIFTSLIWRRHVSVHIAWLSLHKYSNSYKHCIRKTFLLLEIGCFVATQYSKVIKTHKLFQ
jgi:hypothetical protein